MKNIIAGISTLIVITLMWFTYQNGGAFHGGKDNKVIANISKTTQQSAATTPQEKDDRQKEMDKLNALKDKAGNTGAFKVSQEYKSKCASCHGVNGSGFQNGKPMMGPKLFGKSSDEIYKMLVDFKAGRKENVVMKGLLLHMDEEQLRKFADEIGEFPERAKAMNQ